METQQLALIALGSNLGNPPEMVRRAMTRLEQLSDQRILKSSLWRSVPLDCPAGSPLFINAAVGLIPRKDETPEHLLEELQEIEREFGRPPKMVLNEPRPLDLDLIAFGREQRATPVLVLPHPRARERGFVLAPLAEIAPGFVFPGENETIQELLLRLPGDKEELFRYKEEK
jgi:2-amino-4-hydroxy-6-hydroxymethyldihydropteridine diphosphokinase